MGLLLLFFVLVFHNCKGIIYKLNESEYKRMPELFALDDYKDCQLKEGTYCVAKYELYADNNNSLMTIIQEYSKFTARNYNHTYIQRGICIPQSYSGMNLNKTLQTKSDLEHALNSYINETIWKNYGIKSELATVYYCLSEHDEQSEIDTFDWVILAIIAFIIFINIFASFYDSYSNKKNTGNPYIQSFSIMKNWKALTSPSTNKRIEKLKGFRGIKCIATFLMIWAHAHILNMGCFVDNPHDLEKSYEIFPYTLIYGGMMLMQVFFVLTGFLLAYHLNLYTETFKVSWTLMPKAWCVRWWRLTPSNAIMVAIYATWMRHLGSGPLWNFAVTPVAMECRQYWWHHLLYFNNYVSDVGKLCMIQSWQISADLQLFIPGVAICFLTQKCGRNVVLALFLVIGIIIPAVQVWLYDLEGLIFLNPEFFRTMINDTYFRLHILGHTNLSSFIIGIITADITYHCEKKLKQLSEYKILRFLMWCVVPAIFLMMYYAGVIFYAAEERPALWIRMLHQSMHRPIFCIIIAFGIVGMLMKFDGFLSSLVEWNGWLVPSRLCYCAYLIHLMFVHFLLGVKTQLGHVSFFTMTLNYFGLLCVTYLLSLPLYLLVEAPMNDLAKKVFKVKFNNPVPTNNDMKDDSKL